MDTIKAFLSKIRTLFLIPPPPTPLYLHACECGWICINIPDTPKYPWKCLNKLFYPILGTCMIILNFWQAFGDALGSKEVKVLNVSRLYMQGLLRVPNISDYGSIRLNNAWMCLSMPQCLSICQNMADYCWMSLNIPEQTVLTMAGFSLCRNYHYYQ